MSLKGIFGLFGMPDDDDHEDKISKELDDSLNTFRETPYFKVGMFCKLIKNGSNFTQHLLKFFKTSDDPIDMSGVDEASEIMMYNRAFSWIQECDIKNEEWKLAFKDHKEKNILECIVKSIKYYEKGEEYETCAFLKKIQDYIEQTDS
tara:strand:+ start:214 stop:657 length:444 start_codon:yes stop_codon:yes gene_type:complete